MFGTEKLISLVYERKPLWGVQNKNYHSRDQQENFGWKFLTGSEAPDGSPLSAWEYFKQLLFLVDMISSRKLQTSIPSVPSQASEPADDSNQADEYGMADDSITDTDLEVANTSGDTQEAEFMAAAQKDPPASPTMQPFKKRNIQMNRKILKSDAINQLLSLEKRKIEQFEKNA